MKQTPQQKWDKENMASISVKYKKEFVQEFREALIKLELRQSDVIRKAMQDIINKSKK